MYICMYVYMYKCVCVCVCVCVCIHTYIYILNIYIYTCGKVEDDLPPLLDRHDPVKLFPPLIEGVVCRRHPLDRRDFILFVFNFFS
jgi:hypothetical protein